MKPLPYGHCINPEIMKLVTDEELAKLQTEPIATAGEEKVYEIDAETREITLEAEGDITLFSSPYSRITEELEA